MMSFVDLVFCKHCVDDRHNNMTSSVFSIRQGKKLRNKAHAFFLLIVQRPISTSITRSWFETTLDYKPQILRRRKVSCNTKCSAVYTAAQRKQK